MVYRSNQTQADTVIVLDFETSGLSPDQGDRPIEIGAVLVEKGEIKDRFQKLMNPGFLISGFIQDYTGITNEMLKDAPSCAEAMTEFSDFIGDYNLVAHNASFDRRFLEAEFCKVQRQHSGNFACSMLVSRRVYQDAPNHKLGSLVSYKKIENDGVFHRALADSEMTARLWLKILDDIKSEYGLSKVAFSTMQKLGKVPKNRVGDVFRSN